MSKKGEWAQLESLCNFKWRRAEYSMHHNYKVQSRVKVKSVVVLHWVVHKVKQTAADTTDKVVIPVIVLLFEAKILKKVHIYLSRYSVMSLQPNKKSASIQTHPCIYRLLIKFTSLWPKWILAYFQIQNWKTSITQGIHWLHNSSLKQFFSVFCTFSNHKSSVVCFGLSISKSDRIWNFNILTADLP